MTTGFDDLLAANLTYADEYADGGLAGRAARGLAVVTCMDSRIEPLQMLGLSKGDAKILRNAGARVTDDVLRTLVLATHLLGVDRVMVVAHTNCRMATVTDEEVHAAALQYVRKISGTARPSQANAEVFDRAVAEVAAASARLLAALVTTAAPKDREVEAAKARRRAALRYGS